MQSERVTRQGHARFLAVAIWLLMGGVAPAQAGSTADELERLEAEHVVLKAKLRLAETRAQIAARQAETDRQSPYLQNGLPTVVGLDGLDRRMSATLALDNGAQAEVVVGDVLPDGARVLSITPVGVTVLTAAKKQVRLRSAGELAESGRGPSFAWPQARGVGAVGPMQGGYAVPALTPMVRPAPAPTAVPAQPAPPMPVASVAGSGQAGAAR